MRAVTLVAFQEWMDRFEEAVSEPRRGMLHAYVKFRRGDVVVAELALMPEDGTPLVYRWQGSTEQMFGVDTGSEV